MAYGQAAREGWIARFAEHRVAANLLMIAMLVAGLWSIYNMNRQFFPNFALDFVSVRVVWQGASAEDISDGITTPIEQELLQVEGVRSMTSSSAPSISAVTLEFEEGTDMVWATEQIKEKVETTQNLPEDAEVPVVTRITRNDPIARVIVTSAQGVDKIRTLIRDYEQELLKRGIAKIYITGLPDEEIAIQIPMERAIELGLSHRQIGQQIQQMSKDNPAGEAGDVDNARLLRSAGQRKGEQEFSALTIQGNRDNSGVALGSIAEIEKRAQRGEAQISFRGQPAVELQLMRAEHADSLEAAQILYQWMDEMQSQPLPPGVELHRFDERWKPIRDRLMLLLKNGGGGLILVLGILFLFLNGRVATWVAIGIPTSFMATLAVLYAIGGSINMISLFALIMALGIIVDDAIVVGEDALTHRQSGEGPLQAAVGGAHRMLYPILSASLTTMAAFLPLVFIPGVMGKILIDIPIIIICVLIASIIECFLILPGHLNHHAFSSKRKLETSNFRQKLDDGFERFRSNRFRPMITWVVHHRWTTITSAISIFILSIGLLAGGKIGFTFFPSPEGNFFNANVDFVSGTPKARVDQFMVDLEKSLYRAEEKLGDDLLAHVEVRHGVSGSRNRGTQRSGDQFGSIMIEMIPAEERTVRVRDFIRTWKQDLPQVAGLENLAIQKRRHGPPGKDVELRLSSEDVDQLKVAANTVKTALQRIGGVLDVEDDMPYGKEQIVFSLTPEAKLRGLSLQEISNQLRTAFDGQMLQVYHQNREEVEVRVILPEAERERIESLYHFQFITAAGEAIPIVNLVEFEPRKGFEVIRHDRGEIAATVTADLDTDIVKADTVIAQLKTEVLPEAARKHHVKYSFEGQNTDRAETLEKMKQGGMVALLLIYIILAWVFSSYGWPILVILTIPFGLVGAILGHWLMGMDITLLSLFGLFALAGIMVNNSIILISFFKKLREQGLETQEAIIEATTLRLRAVILTSFTTVAGLLPLLFETSLQAQYLIPMAISISFGLMVSTFLVLFFVPAMLSLYEGARARFEKRVFPI